MNDRWLAWAAILGAAAWIPQIISFIYKIIIRPKLQFLPGPTIEIGYTSYGPIVNPSFAISTKRKDVLIEKIELLVKHENGDEHEFLWQFLSEPQYETESSSGETQLFRKNQPVAALKITTPLLVERKIGFQDIAFIKKRMEIYNKLIEKEEHIKKVRPNDFPESLFQEKEWTDMENFIKNEFYWKSGKYYLTLEAYETSSKDPYVESYVFELAQIQVDILARNIEITKQAMKEQYLSIAQIIPALPKRIWAWINPLIAKQTDRE